MTNEEHDVLVLLKSIISKSWGGPGEKYRGYSLAGLTMGINGEVFLFASMKNSPAWPNDFMYTSRSRTVDDVLDSERIANELVEYMKMLIDLAWEKNHVNN